MDAQRTTRLEYHPVDVRFATLMVLSLRPTDHLVCERRAGQVLNDVTERRHFLNKAVPQRRPRERDLGPELFSNNWVLNDLCLHLLEYLLRHERFEDRLRVGVSQAVQVVALCLFAPPLAEFGNRLDYHEQDSR